MRKRHYEFWNPKTGNTRILTPKQASKELTGRFIHEVSCLGMGESLWLYTGERVKCVQ